MVKGKDEVKVGDIFVTNDGIKNFYQVVEVKNRGVVVLKGLIKFMEYQTYRDLAHIFVTAVKDYFWVDTKNYKNEEIRKRIMKNDDGESYIKFSHSYYDTLAYLWDGNPIYDDWSYAWRD